MARRRRFRAFRASPVAVDVVIRSLLAKMGGSPALARLGLLWTNWNEIVGDLAGMAQPVGKQGSTLFIGAENAMHMQELQFRGEELLEIVNDYLQTDYFDRIRFTVYASGKKCRPLSAPAHEKKRLGAGEKRAGRPEEKMNLTGRYLKTMDMSSPVARCYAAYVKNKI